MKHIPLHGVALCIAALLGAANGASAAPKGRLLAGGDARETWIAREGPDGNGFTLYHRQAREAPEAVWRVADRANRLVRHGLACGGGQVWLLYDGLTIESMAAQGEGGPVTATTVTPPPRHLEPRGMAADGQGVWLLARVRDPRVLAAIHAGDFSREPNLPPPAATQAPGRTIPDQDVLLRLERGQWSLLPLPEGWVHGAPAWLLPPTAGAGPLLLASSKAEAATQPDEDRLRVYRHQAAPAATAPAGDDAHSPDASTTGAAWVQVSVHRVRGSAALSPVLVAGQIVLGRYVPADGKPRLLLSLLRPEFEGELPLGEVTLPEVDAAAPWTLTTWGREAALVAWSESRGAIVYSTIDLLGRPGAASVALVQQSPDFRGTGWMVQVGGMVLATLLLLIFWRKDAAGQLRLPRDLAVADLAPRFLAAVIDLAPCLAVATMVSPGTAGLVESWPGFATSLKTVTPGLIAIGLYLTHVVLSELFSGKSLGKAMLNLKVTGLAGQDPHLWQVLARNLLKIMDLVVFPLLVLAIISPLRQRLGDLVARTLVVGPARPDKPRPADDDE